MRKSVVSGLGVSGSRVGSAEQQARRLRQYADCLDYFYYQLSMPSGQAHARPRARTGPAPEGQPTEWGQTLSGR